MLIFFGFMFAMLALAGIVHAVTKHNEKVHGIAVLMLVAVMIVGVLAIAFSGSGGPPYADPNDRWFRR
jgi:hypothetical protein